MERSSGETGSASRTARILAPAALIVVTVIVILVIGGSLGDGDGDGDDEGGGGGGAASVSGQLADCQPTDERAVEQGFYVLKSGENLSSVAAATCITPERLARLNPNLDPQLLPISACIDLVPDGCKALAPD
jgi:hypothetical protein